MFYDGVPKDNTSQACFHYTGPCAAFRESGTRREQQPPEDLMSVMLEIANIC